MKSIAKPLQYEVIYRVGFERRKVETHSRSEAEQVRRELRREGKDASLYIGNLELR